ncbi:MAG: SDR family NAD(P)-dependent oxidoreductase [Chloroflexota bacterium]
MKEFKGKTAVVTGAASGIGKGFAERCAQEGMNVVLADVEERALMHAAEELSAAGGIVLPVATDVSKAETIEALAQKTMDTYGGVHVLFNNAGVGGGSSIWESTAADWEWVLGVNLYGVINGVRTFIPLMEAQNEPCHIINTASILGLVVAPGSGVYNVTKYGVVALSETLYHELALQKSNIHVSVLCPAWVNTQILESDRNRPGELQNAGIEEPEMTPEEEAASAAFAQAIANGLSPEEVADHIFQAIIEEKFYILTHDVTKPWVKERMERIVNGGNPALPPIF